jgi:hypothetical protein
MRFFGGSSIKKVRAGQSGTGFQGLKVVGEEPVLPRFFGGWGNADCLFKRILLLIS